MLMFNVVVVLYSRCYDVLCMFDALLYAVLR
jgi:hypothetical protein